jgi:hypothetical protein
MGSNEACPFIRRQRRLSCPQSKHIGAGSQRESNVGRRSVLSQLMEILAEPRPRFGKSLSDVVQFGPMARFLY